MVGARSHLLNSFRLSKLNLTFLELRRSYASQEYQTVMMKVMRKLLQSKMNTLPSVRTLSKNVSLFIQSCMIHTI